MCWQVCRRSFKPGSTGWTSVVTPAGRASTIYSPARGYAYQRWPAAAGRRHRRFAHRRRGAAERWLGKLAGWFRRSRSRPSTRCATAACPSTPSAFGGKSRLAHDVELSDVRVATPRHGGFAHSGYRHLSSTGYAGSKALLIVRDGDKTWARAKLPSARRELPRWKPSISIPGAPGSRVCTVSLGPLAGEENQRQQCGHPPG